MRKVVKYLLFSLVLSVAGLAQATSPRIIFTDLQSGPSNGGANNKGAIVSVYGFGFGSSQGSATVTINGAPAGGYLQWSETKISFQLGASATSGNVVVNVPGAAASNGMPFTVRSGRIYFVSTAGADTNSGLFASPWRSIVHAKNAARRGDIIYVMDGVSETGLDSSGATLAIGKSGTSNQPIAIVAYPGANVTIGSATGQQYGIRTTATANNWVIAGVNVRGAFSALTVSNSSNWRIVGNDISCPNGSGAGACVSFSSAQGVYVYRNLVHDNGSTSSTSIKLYQAVQFEAGSNNIDVGWNEIANTRSCRALQFYSESGSLYNVTVRNNLIHDSRCDAINFATVDPVAGAVKAYGNVIYRAGTGPAPGGIESNYACVNVGGTGSAPVQLMSNTLYDCGRRANGDSGAVSASVPVTLVDNIVNALSGESYFAANSPTALFSGNNNLFFGVGAAPSSLSASVSVNADPMFVSAANGNFKLQPGSPAIDAGVDTGIARDMIQTARPQGAAFDLGAYEYTGAYVPPPPPPPPPTQGTITVAPTALAFGSVTVGTSAKQTVTVSNSSSASVTISSVTVSGTGFSQSGLTLPLTLSPGQSGAITVTFAPQATGSVSGGLQVTSNATNSNVTVSLSGTGATAPPTQGTLSVTPTSVAFGSVTVGASTTQTVTVSNRSTVAVTISGVVATGTGFSQSGLALPLTLSPGQSGIITVQFSPTISGSASGNLNIASNATNGSINVALSGSGATVQHLVDVTWNASTSPVVGYNVYRGTQSGGPYTKLNSALITGLAFTDNTVKSGTTYFYVVTDVASDGTESAFSSQVTAVVPIP